MKINNIELTESIKTLIIELSPIEIHELKGDECLVDQLGYQSLSMAELAFALEDKFKLAPIDRATAQRIQTVDNIIAYIEEQVKREGNIYHD
ncbi:acyl carrier protein [Xenorhabdus miraniensis]|uniref:Acyl carrier protein n=1 Tax=Xenorhabdus miraniensis TaxID=351674 RepID=A0A2D0JJN0_9GAMM|nr:phosphopantetheine-binding protein [Xenorhabdus miraniensis]PHM46490.1 acyl carrier protein [Xenorhabdus miraniensis]